MFNHVFLSFLFELNVSYYLDTESPQFIECLETRTIYAPRSSVLGYGWNIIATDNSGVAPDITCNLPQGNVPEGVYDVSCLAIDESENRAFCETEVTIKGEFN